MTATVHITEVQRLEWIRQIDAEECRRSFAWFFRRGWSVVEASQLRWNWHLQALCDTAQAFAEGWLVAHGKATPAMAARQDGYWRAHGMERIEGELLVDHLVVNGGPGTLKSRVWMVYLQAWVWLHAPAAQFVCTSGTGKNVSRDSAHTKDLVSSPWYRDTFRPDWKVGVTSSGQVIDSIEKWSNSAGGDRVSVPWLSSWSGIHADFLFGDDPDDAAKVWSDAAREEVREKYDLAIGNRLKWSSATMMLQQHVHVDDLTSNLKLRGVRVGDRKAIARAKCCGAWSIEHRKRWAAFVLPVEFDPAKRCTTPWGWTDPREKFGEVLFAAQWTPDYIASEKDRLGADGWAAQGNQDPENVEGGQVKRLWFRWFVIEGDPPPFRARPAGCRPRVGDDYDPDPTRRPDEAYVLRRRHDGRLDLDECVLSVDPKNGSKRKKSSQVGLVVVGRKGNMHFILDDRTQRLQFLGTIDAIKEIMVDWARELTGVLVEEKAQGEAATSSLRRDIENATLLDRDGRPIIVPIDLVEGGSKTFEERFNAALPTYRARLVFMRDGAEFADEHIDETCAVPNGALDDRPDAVCQAINHFAEAPPEEPAGRGILSPDEIRAMAASAA